MSKLLSMINSKTIFQNEEDIKTFPNTQKLRESFTSRPALKKNKTKQNTTKEVLLTKIKGHYKLTQKPYKEIKNNSKSNYIGEIINYRSQQKNHQ